LHTSLELLRSEIIYKMQEQKQELELRLDAQRRHMVQREAMTEAQMDELKNALLRLTQEMLSMKATETRRQEELERTEVEKQELLEVIRAMQREALAESVTNPKRAAPCRQCSRQDSTSSKSVM
jgi:E3 ubiquitin-protein ligase NRDP1